MDLAEYQHWLGVMGLAEADVPNILAARRHSVALIAASKEVLAKVYGGTGVGLAAVALGSYGRLEASDASDLDLTVVFDPEIVQAEKASDLREKMIATLRNAGLDIPEKTFDSAINIGGLLVDVGGSDETNKQLTNRVLLLTERACFFNDAETEDFTNRIFRVYSDGRTRGRFMGSLSNDLHRYYRTLCVDYRHKIEEQGKHWAIRYFKLRHSRKLWHLANIVLSCAASCRADGEHDGFVSENLKKPPLIKLVLSMSELSGGPLTANVWRHYDRFLGIIARKETRTLLEALKYEDSDRSDEYRELEDNANAFNEAIERVIDHLYGHRCKAHLVRYMLL